MNVNAGTSISRATCSQALVSSISVSPRIEEDRGHVGSHTASVRLPGLSGDNDWLTECSAMSPEPGREAQGEGRELVQAWIKLEEVMQMARHGGVSVRAMDAIRESHQSSGACTTCKQGISSSRIVRIATTPKLGGNLSSANGHRTTDVSRAARAFARATPAFVNLHRCPSVSA
jgi:hypothetical protein